MGIPFVLYCEPSLSRISSSGGYSMDTQGTLDKIKELVRKGSVSRIVIKKDGSQILNIPVNAGVIGVAIGLTSAKWALLAVILATIGFGCTVEVVKENGEIVNVMDEDGNQKIRDFAADTVEKVKETIPVTISVDVNRDQSEIVDAETEDLPDDHPET